MLNFTKMEANKDWEDVQYTIIYSKDIIVHDSWNEKQPPNKSIKQI